MGTSTSATKHNRDRKKGRLGWKVWGQGELITGNGTHRSSMETLRNPRKDNQGEGEGVWNVAEGAELSVSDVFRTPGFGDGLEGG